MKLRIDTSKIEGYESMSLEDKLKALEGFEYDDNGEELSRIQAELLKVKQTNDSLSSENAEYKRNSRSQLSDKDIEIADMKDLLEAQKKTIDELNKTQRLTKMQGDFLKRGYTEEQALAAAQAWEDGNIDSFLNQSDSFLKSHDEDYKKKLMGGIGTPPAGKSSSTSVDYSKLVSEAQAKGDWQTASYYMRLSQESENAN